METVIDFVPAVHNSGKEANQLKKWFLALLCLAAAGMAMAGCAAGNAAGMGPTQTPAATAEATMMAPTTSPMATLSPEASAEATSDADAGNMPAAAMTPAEAGRLAERISEAVERISEVDDAEVIVHNERVLVAVEFDDQYSAGLDDRMKQTIIDTVREIDDSLTDVEVTDDSTLYGQVKGLGERVAKVTGLDELADDFGDLWDRIVGR